MSEAGGSLYLSPPVQRAARLLRRIGEGDAVTNMSATARALDINRTTLLRLLHTLAAERFIEPRGEAGGWRLGLDLLGLAGEALLSQDLVQVSGPVAAQLAEALQLSAHVGVLEGREVVYLVRRTPNRALVSNIRVGSRLPAHAANMGRIILAHLPRAHVAALFGTAPLPAATGHTPRTLAALQARLAEDAAAGLAWSDGFFEPGVSSVAAVICDATSAPVAALNVTGPSEAFAGAERRAALGAAVRAAAEEISRRLGWPGPARRRNAAKGLEAVG